MNRKAIFAVIAAAFAGSAAAQAPEAFKDDFVSTLTRQQVQGDLIAFKKAGVNPWSGTYEPLKYFKSTRSRDDVTAEYIAARAEVAAATAEDSGSSARRPVAIDRAVSDTLAAAR
ncbi:DUF4148 domain-containing protein [Ramlibacter albus]|uniref:DUF4148 domain-containing protein n=1 Tax=Ramlibacter albus TaxID=2079448 RepID=A0A923M8Q6_9BURK|nr:DUF4148 domain-containing protein [Ramlibacter albus]MBC5764936.1 DUF4148 domain-containing protein [Ramlibacter albus]